MRGSNDRSIGEAARGLLGRLDRGGNLERARAVAAWQEVAGPEVARHAVGHAMRDGELVVYADSPAWASELAAMSEQYRTAVNEALGKEVVGSIRFTVSQRVRRLQEEHDSDAGAIPGLVAYHVQPARLAKAEREDLARMAEVIHDDRLRQAALRAARRDLEWKKGLRRRKSPQAAPGGLQDPESGSEH
jgi:hypothetical protein